MKRNKSTLIGMLALGEYFVNFADRRPVGV
jgi:hypothetical protein